MGGGHCFDIKKTVAEPLQGSRKELGGVGGGHCFVVTQGKQNVLTVVLYSFGLLRLTLLSLCIL